MIRFSRVSKSFDGGRTFAVRELDLDVRRGELFALTGASGSGKTTTLEMVNRLVEPTGGAVSVDGRLVAEEEPAALRRRIGYAIQDVGLFPHLDVAANVATVPALTGWERERIRRRVDEMLEWVRLDPATFRHRLPHELSGGQRQRVGLARALAAGPAVLLLDEPFGALDPATRAELVDDFRALHERAGLTTMLVTHDAAEALTLADRVGVMAEGRLVRVGTPRELLTDPGDERVAAIVGTPARHAARIAKLAEGPGGSGTRPS